MPGEGPPLARGSFKCVNSGLALQQPFLIQIWHCSASLGTLGSCPGPLPKHRNNELPRQLTLPDRTGPKALELKTPVGMLEVAH